MLCDANLENVHKSENMKEPNEDAPVPLQETSMDEVNLMLILNRILIPFLDSKKKTGKN